MREDRLRVWEVLKGIGSRCDIKKWCLLGDFNCVKSPNEREGVGVIGFGRREREEYNAFIESLELMDTPLEGRKFS